MSGKQIRLFLVDGTPGGLTTLEIGQWVGHLVSGPRSQLGDLLKRPEPAKPGVYLLLGYDAAAVEQTVCYIGESDDVGMRLRQHKDKDYWDRVVVITSKDEQLTKGHVKYLESRLTSMAARARRCELKNGNEPRATSLPEADRSDMEYFIDQIQIALPVLGINILRSAVEPAAPTPPAPVIVSPVFHLAVAKKGIDARAQQIDGEFTLLEGSTVAATFASKSSYSESTTAAYSGYAARLEQLITDGSIRADGSLGHLTRNVVFGSPSTAGAIVTGRSCNGRTSWRTADGITFGAWEERAT